MENGYTWSKETGIVEHGKVDGASKLMILDRCLENSSEYVTRHLQGATFLGAERMKEAITGEPEPWSIELTEEGIKCDISPAGLNALQAYILEGTTVEELLLANIEEFAAAMDKQK